MKYKNIPISVLFMLFLFFHHPGLIAGQEKKPVKTKAEKEKQKEDEDEGDWGEPEVKKQPDARDSEARRRLTELETWLLKFKAENKKKEEEEEETIKLKFSGKYKGRLNYRDNLNLNNLSQRWEFDNETYFDQRLQIKLEAFYKFFSAVILLDSGFFELDWKEGNEGTLKRWGEYGTFNPAIFHELYVQYISEYFVVKMGRLNWIVGRAITLEGPFETLSITGNLGQTPLGVINVTAAYIPMAGGYRSYNQFLQTGPPAGNREEVLFARNKLDVYYLGFDIRPTSSTKVSPYFMKVADRGSFGDADLNLDRDFNFNTVPRDGKFEPFFMGIYYSGKYKSLSIDSEAILIQGTYTKQRNISAYAFSGEVNYNFGKVGFLEKLSMGVEGAVGSGNDADPKSPTGTFKEFKALFLCKDRYKFGNIFSEDLHAGYTLWDSNLSNISYIQFHIEAWPIKHLKIDLALTKLWTTERVYKGRGPIRDWSNGASTSPTKTNDVGFEVDLNFKTSLPFGKGYRFEGFVQMGYFIPGSAYQRADGRNANSAFEFIIGGEFIF